MRLFKIVTFIAVCGLFLSFTGSRQKPTLFIIGDSTVKNGRGDGAGGLYGWGQVIDAQFDTSKITIRNHAIGGRSSRSFIEEGRWDTVLKYLQPGDYVLMQFGHNDGGSLNTGRARGTLKGNGEETETVIMENDSSERTIHTYGWYMRKYARETIEKGAMPILVSYIPRNQWENGKIKRGTYGPWTAEAAKAEEALFLDLNELTAKKYDELGEDLVRLLFFTQKDHTHTTLAGAQLNAYVLAQTLRNMEKCNLKNYLK